MLAVFTIRDEIVPGEYTLNRCADTDGTLNPGNFLCLSAVYTNMGVVAANPNGGTLNLTALDPLQATLSADMTAANLPTTEETRYNANSPVTFRLEIAGQARTN